jgi:hypothetical protein
MSFSTETHVPVTSLAVSGSSGPRSTKSRKSGRFTANTASESRVLASGIEYVRRDRAVSGHADDHVGVRRSPWIAAGRSEHLADWAVSRDRVWHRAHAQERVRPVITRLEAAAQLRLGSIAVLHHVQPVVAVLPYVKLGTGNRASVDVTDPPVDQCRIAGRYLGDRTAVWPLRRAGGVESPTTVDWVAPAGNGFASTSTSIEMPSVSDRSMNSCRRSSVMLPVAVRIRIAATHSECVRCTSVAEARR